MVSWNLPARIVGRKASRDLSDSSQQESIQAAPHKEGIAGRRIHFNLDKSTVHPHYCLDELTPEEYDSLWITAQEFMASKQAYVAVVRRMMKTIGQFPETDDCCIRGLGTLDEGGLFFTFTPLRSTKNESHTFSFSLTFRQTQNSKRKMAPDAVEKPSKQHALPF
jgi:hypothetical protein